MKRLLCFLLILQGLLLNAQEKKTVPILRISDPLNIDGNIDENVYNDAVSAKDFVQLQPYNGRPAYQPSEAWIFYDQTAVYVGAKLYDSSPDSIYNFLSQRDQIGASDYFGVYFDPFNQGQVAYGFFITPAGVQTDIKASKTSSWDNEDPNWNAVWQSKTRITNDGWNVEMRIPYSALRFPENGGGNWGLQMFRNVRRYNSNSSWNLINTQVQGFIHQEGQVEGITDIKPPVRLSLSPFSAVYTDLAPGTSAALKYKGGLDVKYGINESFTLDMMLIPDFGQIQSDYKRMNLSPFELYYSERRQFFTEGTELFNKGDVFYSRRIGAAPKFTNRVYDSLQAGESVFSIPSETQILNATKISGRTSNGWGLGSLNAITLPSYAVIQDDETQEKRRVMIQPLTNFNVSVVDRTLKNNSYISLINTNILMAGDNFFSNVTATDFQLRNKAKTFALKGKGGISFRNPDEKETGYFSTLSIEKNSGKLQFGLSQRIYSDKYNPNDLGYLQRNNEFTSSPWIWYTVREPFWIFRETSQYLIFNHNRMYRNLDFSGNEVFLNSFSTFKNNYSFLFNAWVIGQKNDYYEPRVPGRYYTDPAAFRYQLGMFSDHSKPVNFGIRFMSTDAFKTGKSSKSLNLDMGLRLGRKFEMHYATGLGRDDSSMGFTGFKSGTDTIVFAKRNIRSFENSIHLGYTINNSSGITLSARHYSSSFKNEDFNMLGNDGTLSPVSYDSPDGTFNMLNVDFVFRWIFAPGSELSLAWKETVFDNRQDAVYNYGDNLKNIFRADQTDSFSLKILYYLDYNSLRRNK